MNSGYPAGHPAGSLAQAYRTDSPGAKTYACSFPICQTKLTLRPCLRESVAGVPPFNNQVDNLQEA